MTKPTTAKAAWVPTLADLLARRPELDGIGLTAVVREVLA